MKTREKRTWSLKGAEACTPLGKPIAEVEKFHTAEMCRRDLRYLYENVCAEIFHESERSLGRIHLFFLDFLRLEELKTIPTHFRHSTLSKYIPEKDEEGNWKERWLYWPTLDGTPTVQDGPEGEVATMYKETFWKGMLVHFAGNGSDKAVLLPRNHLKTTLGTQLMIIWEAINDPSLRHLIRGQRTPLTAKFLSNIRRQFDTNDKLRSLFGDLIPDKKELPWHEEAISLRAEKRRGAEATVEVLGVEADVTGSHYDRIHNDDVQGELNSATPEQIEKIKMRIQCHSFVRARDSKQYHIGTRWAGNDVHSTYLTPGEPAFGTTSWMIATVKDAEDKPIWKEHFRQADLDKLRKECKDDYTWYAQFYNQPIAPESQTFKGDWLQYYKMDPLELAKAKRLNIFITCDPASSKRKKADCSACVVQGQSQDGVERYLLDGFRDRVSPEMLPQKLVEICALWKSVAENYGGGFRFGIEATGFQSYIAPAIRNAMRANNAYFNIEELTHAFATKRDRIKVLAAPYAAKVMWWPEKLPKKRSDGKGYDFVAEAKDEYLRFSPTVSMTHDDILDAMAYQESLLRLRDGPVARVEARPEDHPGVYLRANVKREHEAEEGQRPGYRTALVGAYRRDAGNAAWRRYGTRVG